MIIDTESPEGKALVALAKLGDTYLRTVYGASERALLSVSEEDYADCVYTAMTEAATKYGCINFPLHELTDLAKLPDGLT